ncbi:MAG: hypothetical protein J2P15_23975, partial [Micromonosporaceae bacterium]|nr:hypothetical protein [Micromonosporaceae bacterium]
RRESVGLPQAAGQPDVRVRFHYVAHMSILGGALAWWQLDDVQAADCHPVPGGLVLGQVDDGNTGAGVNGARISSVDNPADSGLSQVTPDDPAVPDGFGWLFSSLTGTRSFTARAPGYQPDTRTVQVLPDSVARAQFTLGAGRLAVTPGSLAPAAVLGGSQVLPVTITNTGTQPVRLRIAQRSGSFTQAGAAGTAALAQRAPGGHAPARMQGAAVRTVPGRFSPLSQVDRPASAAPAAAAPDVAPWVSAADYPESTMDAGAALAGGRLYVFGGFSGAANTNHAFDYDPARQSWSAIANVPIAGLENPAVAAIGGKIYLTGGWNLDGSVNSRSWVYDPAGNSYRELAPQPVGLAASGRAVLDGMLYTVGGCQADACDSAAVQRYDPATDAWSRVADYPEPIAQVACGAISEAIYCAGGIATGQDGTRDAYVYDPRTDGWSPVAPLPIDLWGASYTAASDTLLVSGGVTQSSTEVTNQSFGYQPATDTWVDVPPPSNVVYRAASACGFYRIGGSTGGLTPTRQVEQLPGFDDCDDAVDVDWLSVDRPTASL